MRALNIVLSTLVVAAVAGCSSGSKDANDNAMQTSNTASVGSADYRQDGTYMADTSAGSVMTSPSGMTVYTFDKDQGGTSACYGDCAAKWPPVVAASSAQPYGEMTLITRTDGQQQWAYDGKPLYYYYEDNAAGDVNGDNVGGVWHVVK